MFFIHHKYNAAGQKLSKTSSTAYGREAPYTVSEKMVYEYDDNRLVQTKDSMLQDRGGFALFETTVFHYSDDSGNETVNATSVTYANGRLPYNTQKATGKATFKLNPLPRGVYLIHGSSGWAKKIVRN